MTVCEASHYEVEFDEILREDHNLTFKKWICDRSNAMQVGRCLTRFAEKYSPELLAQALYYIIKNGRYRVRDAAHLLQYSLSNHPHRTKVLQSLTELVPNLGIPINS